MYQLSGPVCKSIWLYTSFLHAITFISHFVIDFLSIIVFYAIATYDHAVPIVKQKVGAVNVEAAISCACAVCVLETGLAYLRAISMAGRALASSQLDGCYGPFGMSASTWT